MIRNRKLHSALKMGPWVAAGIVWALCVPFDAAAQGGFIGPGRYQIANQGSGKVLDLDRNDQSSVAQFSSRGTDNQVWDIRPATSGFYYVVNAMNGNALESGGNRNPSVRATRFNGGPAQQWRFDADRGGNALIVSRLGNTLDIPGGTNAEGARVQMYAVNGGSNQRFSFRQSSQSSGNWDRGDGRNGNSSANTITCSSDNGQRVYCGADTRAGVRMVRQLSGSPCDQRTWGYDSRGIWVDRGCRAEFDVSGRGSNGNDNGGRTSNGNESWGRTWNGNDNSNTRGVETIRAGASIVVRTNEYIDVRNSDGRVFSGVVYQDVLDDNRNVAIPRGSNVELIVRFASNRELVLDLESVDVNGRRYSVSAGADVAGARRDGVGANQRTGEYVGGGALLGTIIGAIAGGGRGAAIGAGAGAGAGVGVEVLTRGRAINVPAESVLTFRLEQPLQLAVGDHGFNRNGQHYHDQNR